MRLAVKYRNIHWGGPWSTNPAVCQWLNRINSFNAHLIKQLKTRRWHLTSTQIILQSDFEIFYAIVLKFIYLKLTFDLSVLNRHQGFEVPWSDGQKLSCYTLL